MRKFYLLAHEPSRLWKSIEDYDLSDFDDFNLMEGEKLEEGPGSEVSLTVSDDGQWPDYLNNPLSWHIISSKLKPAFEGNGDVIFFPINSLLSEDAGFFDYQLMSIYNPLDCLDKQRSEFEEEDGWISSITKVVIDDSKVPSEIHFFLIDKCTSYLVVNSLVKEKLEKLDASGLGFVPTEN